MYTDGPRTVETPQSIRPVLPSWVPDFSKPPDIYPIPKLLHVTEDIQQTTFMSRDRRGLPTVMKQFIPSFRPLGDTESGSFIDGDQLRVSGVRIDILKDIIKNLAKPVEVGRATAKEQGRAWVTETNFTYFTGESWADAYNRNFLMDLVYNDSAQPSKRGGKVDVNFTRKLRAELSLKEYRYQTNVNIAKRTVITARDVRFSEKLYLSMIPNTSVIGDEIWSPAGEHALYILRPLDIERYRYIGECYTDGLMDGEIVRQVRIGEVSIEYIILI